MRIERISTNQIRCTLSSIDLQNRNLNVIELAYGSDNAKALFREMLHKASYEVGFDTDDTPLMIEAVPMSGENIVIYITKVDDPDELDTRFAKFAPAISDDILSTLDIRLDNLLEGAIELNDSQNSLNAVSESYLRAFSFDSLDKFILVLKKNDNKKDFSAAANILSEYGSKLSATSFSDDYYKEHFKILVRENAVSQMAKI